MQVKGKRIENNVNIEVEPKEIVKTLYYYLGFNNWDFVKDNKICYETEEGYHNTWFETHIKSEDIEKVNLLKALELIKNTLKVSDFDMKY
jgi:hypothetical protein